MPVFDLMDPEVERRLNREIEQKAYHTRVIREQLSQPATGIAEALNGVNMTRRLESLRSALGTDDVEALSSALGTGGAGGMQPQMPGGQGGQPGQMTNAQVAGQLMVDHVNTWPDMPPGAVTGLSVNGVNSQAASMPQIAERAAKKRASSGVGFKKAGEVTQPEDVLADEAEGEERNWLSRTMRATTRGLTAAADILYYDGIRRPIVATGTAMADPDTSLGEAWAEAPFSAATIGAASALQGGDTGYGEGFFHTGGEAQERHEKQNEAFTLDGTFVTPGRLLMRNVTEPGTKPYNFFSGLIDATAMIGLDPASYLTGGAAKVGQVRRTFQASDGLLSGIRKGTDADYAKHWLTATDPGQRLTRWATQETDAHNIWTATGKKIGTSEAHDLSRLETEQQVRDYLLPRLGTSIKEKPVGSALSRAVARTAAPNSAEAVGGVGIAVRRANDRARLTQWMPAGRGINIADKDHAVESLDRWMKGAKFSREERAHHLNQAMALGEGNQAGLLNVTENVMSDAFRKISTEQVSESTGWVGRALKRVNDSPNAAYANPKRAARANEFLDSRRRAATRATQLYMGELNGQRTFWAGEAARFAPNGRKLLHEGKEVDWANQPHLMSEYINQQIPLPDMQSVRREIGKYADVLNTVDRIGPRLGWGTRQGMNSMTDLVSGVMSSVWKPFVLLRGAYVARVGGEEQVRMGAAGLDSMVRHPASYLMFATGKRGATSPSGTPLKDMEEWAGILQRSGGGHVRHGVGVPDSVYTGDWVTYSKSNTDPSDFARAWASDVSFLTNDEIATQVARAGDEGLNGVKDWLWSGPGQKFRKQLAEADHHKAVLRDRGASDAYVDSVWRRIQDRTGGDADIMNLIATGRTPDGEVLRGVLSPEQGRKANRFFRNKIDSAPEEVKAAREVQQGGRRSTQISQQLNGVIDALAHQIMSRPTNAMSRSQTWKQYFWSANADLVGFASGPVQRQMIDGAKEARMSREFIRGMERRAAKGAGDQVDNYETVELLAKARATDQTRSLLYELTEMGQFSDLSRAIFPFAEAWKEIGVAWGRILKQRPQTARRGQMAVQGARDSGFFHEDPSTKEEMFTYPGGGMAARMLGIDDETSDLNLTGMASGLNLFTGSMIPGVGPAVSIPASKVIPDTSDFNWLRDIVHPFGEPDTDRGIAQAVAPAWMQKVNTALRDNPDADRLYANSQKDLMVAMEASGDYDAQTASGQERLLADAREKNRGLWLIRGLAQFVLPTGPSVRMEVSDLEGEMWPYQVVATEYNSLKQEHGEDQAMQELIGTFGTDVGLLIQPKSQMVNPVPSSERGRDWINDNPEIMDAYPATGGLLAPDDAAWPFDYSGYQQDFKRGDREQLNPQEMLWLHNDTLGRLAYANVQKMYPGSDGQSRQLKQSARAQLMQQYPGYNRSVGAARPGMEAQLTELKRMSQDPRLEDNPVVGAIRQYEEALSWAQRAARSVRTGGTYKSSQDTMWIREQLREKARQIRQETPEFTPVWENVYSRQINDEEADRELLSG